MCPKSIRSASKRRGNGRLIQAQRFADTQDSGVLAGRTEWTMIPKWDPFPVRTVRSLAYGAVYTLTSGAIGIFGTEQAMRLNSLYDPDLTGAGHQPYGFDTLMSLYRNYKVLSTTVSLSVHGAQTDYVIVGALITPSIDTTVLAGSSYTVMGEKPAFVALKPSNLAGGPLGKIQRKFTLPQIEGISKVQLEADTSVYTGTAATNPQASPQLHLAASSVNGGSSETVMVEVRLLYETVFWERYVLPQS